MTAPAAPMSSAAPAPAQQGQQLARVAQIENGHTRLTRRLGPVHGFPRTLMLGGCEVQVAGEPELILLVDLYSPAEGEYRHRYVHDVVCQILLTRGVDRCTINVNLITSRTAPATEAALVQGSVRPLWLNLSEADDVICGLLSGLSIRERYSDSITAFIERWVSEYSLRAIASLKDEAVAAALRQRDATLYSRLLSYLDELPGANVDTISHHMRSALVSPQEIAALIAKAPLRPLQRREHPEFERTMEIRGERSRRDQAA